MNKDVASQNLNLFWFFLVLKQEINKEAYRFME